MQDKEFLETIVKELVEKPEDVVVEREIDERGVLLTLKVNPEEMGKIIGKQGQTARSLRTLLRIVGNKNNSYVNLKVYEPEKEGGAPREAKAAVEPVAEAPIDNDVEDLKL
ncbi:KH domain-containing protein [Candidatus Parcubacteria bacterium]|nr:KH domain-containing protein [Candidatus Parcubacteria bacterium]